MKPFFKYYGGKYRSAPKYPAPEHDTIVEPFAGAAGYSTRFGVGKRVILVDLDPIVAGVWKYLIRSTPNEIRRLPLLQEGQTVDDLPICPEARDLVGFWLNVGASSPRKRPSSWMRDGRWRSQFWGEHVRERVASQVSLIKSWEVREGSYEDLDPMMEATWFIDPPYQVGGKHYRCSEVDFESLGIWCASLTGLVVVCEAKGADWMPFEVLGAQKAMSKKGAEKGHFVEEVVYVQRDGFYVKWPK